ncbi:hypothetical protein Q6293_29040, partial [Klebsiella pneumoniae]|uniref:hypothetical protein n=1 Tax=Klebsiella pneumoniae TaxID=573 RepID=UPI00272F9507
DCGGICALTVEIIRLNAANNRRPLDPIDIYFDIDEQSYLKYRRQAHTASNQSQVRIALPGEAAPVQPTAGSVQASGTQR